MRGDLPNACVRLCAALPVRTVAARVPPPDAPSGRRRVYTGHGRGGRNAKPVHVGDRTFGSFTGGLDVEDAAIAANFSGPYRAMLVARGRLLSLPCGRTAENDATADAPIAANRR